LFSRENQVFIFLLNKLLRLIYLFQNLLSHHHRISQELRSLTRHTTSTKTCNTVPKTPATTVPTRPHVLRELTPVEITTNQEIFLEMQAHLKRTYLAGLENPKVNLLMYIAEKKITTRPLHESIQAYRGMSAIIRAVVMTISKLTAQI